MKIKLKPEDIFDEYSTGRTYNESHDLYENVEKNENFYVGEQWKGVNADNLMKPVFNIVKRVVSYYISQIASDDIGVHVQPFDATEANEAYCDMVSDLINNVIERTDIKAKARTNVRNCAVDGDTAMVLTFDPDVETNDDVKGDIKAELIDNTNIIFGNPYSDDLQSQPYILVVQRLFTEQVKDMAEEYGAKKDDVEKIVSDSEDIRLDDADDELTTVITKFWKEKKMVDIDVDPLTGVTRQKTVNSVHFMKVTSNVVIKDDTDLEYNMYPIAYMTWEHTKNSYHGRSPITGLIPNQIFINKTFAMCMVYMTNQGFPKVFYDNTKLSKLSNDVTKNIALPNMDMAGKLIDAVKAPDFSNQITQLIDTTITYTKEFMGASDAALGELANPNNTSAIVAVQEASTAPLELQKLAFHDFYEQVVRIIIDIIGCQYGNRMIKLTESQAKQLNLVDHVEYIDKMTNLPAQPIMVNGQLMEPQNNPNVSVKIVYKTSTRFDFSALKNMNYDISVDIGQSTYWSEQTQVTTISNLFDKGIITDPVTFLECMPDKYIPNKQKLIDKLKGSQDNTNISLPQQEQPSLNPYNDAEALQADPDMRASAGQAGSAALQQVYATAKDKYGGKDNVMSQMPPSNAQKN